MARGNTTSARTTLAREREQKVFALRKAGKSYPEIARELGFSEAAAYKALKRVLARLEAQTAEDAVEVRRLELERLDAMLAGPLWKRAAEDGDEKAVASVVRLMERRAALLGLDAPPPGRTLRVNITAAELAAMTDEQLDELARRLAGRAH